MREAKTKLSQYIRTLTGRIASWMRRPQPPQASASSNWYRACKDLPMARFIDVLVDGRHDALVISGTPDKADLLAAWRDIYSEYAQLVQNKDSEAAFKLVKRIAVLRLRIERVEILLAALEARYSTVLADHLRSCDLNFPFNPADAVAYESDLRKAGSTIKRWYVDLKLMEGELESGKKTSGRPATIDRRYFDDMLLALSKFMGYRVSAGAITVSEYAGMVRMHEAHVEQINKRQKTS